MDGTCRKREVIQIDKFWLKCLHADFHVGMGHRMRLAWRPRALCTAILSCLGWLALACGMAATEEATPQPNITVVGTTGGTLSLSTMEPQLDWPILVRRNDGGAAAVDVQLDVSNLVSPSGRLQEVKLQKDGADFDGKLTLPAFGQTALRLVAAIPEEGTYTGGEIGIVVDRKRQPVQLKVTRTVREVVVVGTTGGALQFTTPEPDLVWPIIIRRNDNAPGARNIRVELGPLVAPSGQVVRGWSCAGTAPPSTGR